MPESAETIEAVVRQAVGAQAKMRLLASFERSAALQSMRHSLLARKEEFARTICEEVAKPITDARVEVDRAALVLQLAAEEANRIGGETMPLDLIPANRGRFALTRRFPIGPILGITPYNFPLNLGMHKLAPAIAVGSAFVWKPSLLCPRTARLLESVAAGSGLPQGAVQVATPSDAVAESLVQDPRIAMLSFTGSASVGWKLRSLAGTKKVTLELGGNAAAIVCADADLDHAVTRCTVGGFAYSGQICISVQRIFVEQPVYETFLAGLVRSVQQIPTGNPNDESTRMGPMVSDREADRVYKWIEEAVDLGASIMCGGARDCRFIAPTVLTNVPASARLYCEEAFGPVVLVEPFDDWEEVLRKVNTSKYGLQAGLFTNRLDRMWSAFEQLEVGGLIVNDVPTFRSDNMPYGGVKASGLGREGVRYAMEEMSEVRVLAVRSGGS